MSFIGADNNINTIEELSCKHTGFHNLMPVSKLITTLVFIGVVVSYGAFEVFALLPYFAYIIWIMLIAELPFLLIIKRMAVALPFVFFIGLSNILLIPQTAFNLNGWPVTYGFLSLVSLLFKTVLAVSAGLILAATTRLHDLCSTLIYLKVPTLFVTALTLTYRFISVLAQEARHMTLSYRLRTGRQHGIRMRHMGMLGGQLLLRSNARAGRVYDAMQLKGFFGMEKTQRPDMKNLSYMLCLSLAFALMRIFDLTQIIGTVL